MARRLTLMGCWLACAVTLGCDTEAQMDGVEPLAADAQVADAAPDGAPTPDAQPLDAAPGDAQPLPLDQGAPDPDQGRPEPDQGPPPEVTCEFAAAEGEQEVNTWMGQADRAVFTVPLPAVAGVRQATLRFEGWDLDNVGEEGWIRLNRAERMPLPSDAGWTNTWQPLSIDVTGQVVEGPNQVRFLAFERPEGSFFRVRGVRLELTGQVDCPAPMDPVDPMDPPDLGRVANRSPLGISAFAALAPDFPRADTLGILGALDRPFTTVLLDFAPVYAAHGLRMFAPGAVGQRAANPAHLAALQGFIQAYLDATPEAESRHLQIYLFNGPGIRRPSYARAFDLDPSGFDRAVRQDAAVRADVLRFGQALVAALAPHRDAVDIRLVGALEDDLSRDGAQALNRLLRDAGWDGDLGRNPCGCAGPADTSRVGQFHELHPHSLAATQQAARELAAPDALSNDGWGWHLDGPNGGRLDGAATAQIVRAAHDAGVWFHLWYDPIQGYPVPANGPRDLRFDHPAAQVLGWIAAGVAAPGADEPTGLGREQVLGYREGTYEPRRNWVLDCRDYAYSARFDEHRECDARYNPDGTGRGTATFVFQGVPRDLYEVALEGRNTENRNPAQALVVVNGVERRLNQIGEGEFSFELHGTYLLEGQVTVVLDSTREAGSDSVRRVRIRPAGR